MLRIGVFCAGGMSTSMLVKKMLQAAKNKNIEVTVKAYPESQLERGVRELDVILLAPQVGYVIDKCKETCEVYGVNVEVISTQDYGMLNGEKVLNRAIEISK